MEGTLSLYNIELNQHKADCLVVRGETKDELQKLRRTIEDNHNDWKSVVASMDRGNVKRLTWINGLLITILISVLGFLGDQIWTHIIK